MKCPKCNKKMVTGSYIVLSPKIGTTPDYWFCSDRKNCGYEIPKKKG